VEEFLKDYDKLRCGAVNLNVFSRAMDLCGFELSGDDLQAIQLRHVTCMPYSIV